MIETLYNLKKWLTNTYIKYLTVDGKYSSLLPDKIYLQKLYKKRFNKTLNLKNPQTFNEKIQWLKLYNRKPEYTMMVDKYAVRQYIAAQIGEQYLVPLLGVWNTVEEINFETLPNSFVLKANHDNGVIICRDKSTLDLDETKKQLSYHLNRNYWKKYREWPYKNVKRKIIAEQFMENISKKESIDFKLFCFNGVVKFCQVISGRFSPNGVCVDMYDFSWNHLDIKEGNYPNAGDVFEKPNCMNELKDIAQKLSQNIPFLRVDFNYWNNKLYFGELTFFPFAGFIEYYPLHWGKTFGDWLKLPK